MFLLVTNKRDITSDFIVLELKRRSLPYYRLNTEDIPRGSLNCRPASGHWSYFLDGKGFELSEIRAGYFRRPGMPEALRGFDEDDQAYCVGEWAAALQSLYWKMEGRWLNSPTMISLAENKVRQLELATELGFRIPETLITNDPEELEPFVSNRGAIGKPLRNALVNGPNNDRVVFTSRINPDATRDPDAVRATPIILQEEIPKRYDVRATVVGSKVFAASIDSQGDPETQVDWRRMSKPDLPHSVAQLPVEVENACVAITARLGLRFGAIDLVADRSGEHWFLEINPNGQWGWIETRTGLPIAAAIVSELEAIGS